MWRDELRGVWAIVQKDMRTYYLKPPAVSWGIVFHLDPRLLPAGPTGLR
jgi:ABC-2 type transport system permease protein